MPEHNDPDRFNIRVVKLRDHVDAYPISRGYPLSTKWPNRDDESNRDENCDRYDEYFHQLLDADDEKLTTELARLVGKTIDQGYLKIGCYCSPKRCHGDTIAAFLNSVLN